MLPNCIINGVAKSGTTSLYHYLKAHHQVFMSERKELNYFSLGKIPESKSSRFIRPVQTIEEYQSYFDGSEGYKVRGEASPSYFSTPGTARFIKSEVPNIKFITTLRNPSERAYSGYLMNLRGNKVDPKDPKPFSLGKHWVETSFYYDRLKEYYDVFESDQIEVVLMEDLKSNRDEVLLNVFRYLGIDSQYDFKKSSKIHNAAVTPKYQFAYDLVNNNKFIKRKIRPLIPHKLKTAIKKYDKLNRAPTEKIPADVREHLNQLFKDDIAKVENLIGKDLNVWR